MHIAAKIENYICQSLSQHALAMKPRADWWDVSGGYHTFKDKCDGWTLSNPDGPRRKGRDLKDAEHRARRGSKFFWEQNHQTSPGLPGS